jgi:hypothetical protein
MSTTSNTVAVAHAIEVALELTAGANSLITLAGQVGTLIAQAQAEGRDISAADWDALDAGDGAARQALADAIAKRLPAA